MKTTLTLGSQSLAVYFNWLNETAFEIRSIYWRNIDVLPLLKGTVVYDDIVEEIAKQANVGAGNEEAV